MVQDPHKDLSQAGLTGLARIHKSLLQIQSRVIGGKPNCLDLADGSTDIPFSNTPAKTYTRRITSCAGSDEVLQVSCRSNYIHCEVLLILNNLVNPVISWDPENVAGGITSLFRLK